MAVLDKKIVLGWYGSCESCVDFEFYDPSAELKSQLEGITSIQQTEGGYYMSWTKSTDFRQRLSYETKSDDYKSVVTFLDHVRDGQDIIEFKCGYLYLITREEGAPQVTLDHFFNANGTTGDKGRVIECPEFPECICGE